MFSLFCKSGLWLWAVVNFRMKTSNLMTGRQTQTRTSKFACKHITPGGLLGLSREYICNPGFLTLSRYKHSHFRHSSASHGMPSSSGLHAWGCVRVHHSVLSSSLWPHGLQPARLFCPWDFPGKNTGMGCRFLLQGIFQTQGLHPCLWGLNGLVGGVLTSEPPGKP